MFIYQKMVKLYQKMVIFINEELLPNLWKQKN